jgi:hypothetical protein
MIAGRLRVGPCAGCGGGCTGGHEVCGISRLRACSLIATAKAFLSLAGARVGRAVGQGTLFFVRAMLAGVALANAGGNPHPQQPHIAKIIGNVQCSVESGGYRRCPNSAEKRISTSLFLRCPECRTPRSLVKGNT